MNVGVIGVGMIGQDHVRRLTTVLSGSAVVAVTDVDPARAQGVAARVPGARVHPTGQDLIQDDAVDAVVVASWGPPTRSTSSPASRPASRSSARSRWRPRRKHICASSTPK